MYRFADNVVETSTATTTGAYQLAGVPSGAGTAVRVRVSVAASVTVPMPRSQAVPLTSLA